MKPNAMLEIVAQAVINGLLMRGIYALVSVGVTLILQHHEIVQDSPRRIRDDGMYISFFPRPQLRTIRPIELLADIVSARFCS